MTQQEIHSLDKLCSMPIISLVKSQIISHNVSIDNIKSMFNEDSPKYLKLGKIKIPLIDFMQYSMLNIDIADLEFNVDIHSIEDEKILGMYGILNDNSNINIKIRVKRDTFTHNEINKKRHEISKTGSEYIT